MANIRRMYLRAEMSDGDTVELLNFTVGSDGKVQKLDESSLDTLLDTPEVAKMWATPSAPWAARCSLPFRSMRG